MPAARGLIFPGRRLFYGQAGPRQQLQRRQSRRCTNPLFLNILQFKPFVFKRLQKMIEYQVFVNKPLKP
jgi:hypothetical protein